MMTNLYRDADGQRLPSVTTIIGRFKDSGGLIRWAYQNGADGGSLNAGRNQADDAGTLARAMVIAHLRGTPWQPGRSNDTDTLAMAISGFNAYLNWERRINLAIRYTDVVLVSSRYRYGGTLAAVGEIAGKLVLLDWKASNAVYPDQLTALAACKTLWDENTPDHLITGGYHLFRFSKGAGDFTHHSYPSLNEAWQQFRLFRRAYDIDARLRRRVSANALALPADRNKAKRSMPNVPQTMGRKTRISRRAPRPTSDATR